MAKVLFYSWLIWISLPESWVAQYGFEGVSENKVSDGFRVFPNPTDGVIVVESSMDGEFRIINIMGQTMMAGPLNHRMDVSELPSGIYFIIVGEQTQKLIIS